MITTEQITGVFSKEHTIFVLLIIYCLYGNRNTNIVQDKILTQQTEIQADLKIIKFRLDYEKPTKQFASDSYANQDSLTCLFTNLISLNDERQEKIQGNRLW